MQFDFESLVVIDPDAGAPVVVVVVGATVVEVVVVVVGGRVVVVVVAGACVVVVVVGATVVVVAGACVVVVVVGATVVVVGGRVVVVGGRVVLVGASVVVGLPPAVAVAGVVTRVASLLGDVVVVTAIPPAVVPVVTASGALREPLPATPAVALEMTPRVATKRSPDIPPETTRQMVAIAPREVGVVAVLVKAVADAPPADARSAMTPMNPTARSLRLLVVPTPRMRALAFRSVPVEDT